MSSYKPNSLPIGSDHNLDNIRITDDDSLMNVPYVKAICSLMYPMVCTRLDITYDVSILSRFMMKPKMEH